MQQATTTYPPITTAEAYTEARARYAELLEKMDAAKAKGDYAKRAELARQAVPIENALNAYEAAPPAKDATITSVWVAKLTRTGATIAPVPVRDTGKSLLPPKDLTERAMFDATFGYNRRLERPNPGKVAKDGMLDRWYGTDRAAVLAATVAAAERGLEAARTTLERAEARLKSVKNLPLE